MVRWRATVDGDPSPGSFLPTRATSCRYRRDAPTAGSEARRKAASELMARHQTFGAASPMGTAASRQRSFSCSSEDSEATQVAKAGSVPGAPEFEGIAPRDPARPSFEGLLHATFGGALRTLGLERRRAKLSVSRRGYEAETAREWALAREGNGSHVFAGREGYAVAKGFVRHRASSCSALFTFRSAVGSS